MLLGVCSEPSCVAWLRPVFLAVLHACNADDRVPSRSAAVGSEGQRNLFGLVGDLRARLEIVPAKLPLMAVTLSDEDFEFIYGAFERLMSPTASDEELSEAISFVEAMKTENAIWAVLQRIKGTESAS